MILCASRRRGLAFAAGIVAALLVLGTTGPASRCSAQPDVDGGELQCPHCNAWIPFRTKPTRSIPSHCPSCGRSLSSSPSGGGGGGGGGYSDDGERGPTAMDQAWEDIGELEGKLTPWRQKKQQVEQEIAKLRASLRETRGKISDAKRAAAEAKAQKERQQKILDAVTAKLKQLRQEIEKRLLDMQTALAAVRHGGPAAAAPVDLSDMFSPPAEVYLDDKDLYKKIDPAAFLTLDIYQQALRERDRQQSLRKDLQARLAMMEAWAQRHDRTSDEFVKMLRRESAGTLGDMLDLVAPVEVWLSAGKVSPQLLHKYRVAQAAMRTAVAAYESSTAENQTERDSKLHSAMSGFLETGKEVMGAGLDDATRKQFSRAIIAYEAMGKCVLATSAQDHETKAKLVCEALAALNPYATAAKGAMGLTERALRQQQISAALDGFTDQRKTMQLLRRRLAGKIESLDVNAKESQRIVDLWEASPPKGGRP